MVVLFLCSLSLRKEKKNYVSMADQIPNTKIFSSHCDPKWWLDPESMSPICDSTELFESESCSDNQEHQCDKFEGPAIRNWYVEDLLDQIYSLQKLSNQSVKSYFSEAKSLVFALNCAGESIAEVELIECLVNGLDNSLNGIFQYYYLMHPSLSFDLLYNALLNQEQLLKLVPCISPVHPIANDPLPLQGQDENEIECFIEKTGFNQSVELEDDLAKVFSSKCTSKPDAFFATQRKCW